LEVAETWTRARGGILWFTLGEEERRLGISGRSARVRGVMNGIRSLNPRLGEARATVCDDSRPAGVPGGPVLIEEVAGKDKECGREGWCFSKEEWD
jgi:hypothetical protein